MKIEVPGYPRHVGPTTGHLTECLVVSVYEATKAAGGSWPINDDSYPYCTCDDWSPDQ